MSDWKRPHKRQTFNIVKECLIIHNVFTFDTDIMFVVKVPVLSLQITVVQPKVSTDGRDLTIAFNRAILFVPRARQLYKLKKATLSIQFENKKPYATMQVIHEEDAKSFRWVFCYFPTQQHHFTISETGVQCSRCNNCRKPFRNCSNSKCNCNLNKQKKYQHYNYL